MNSLVKHLSGERRSARRYDVKVPLRYRLRTSSALELSGTMGHSGTVEHTGESENMSELGVYFLTDTELRVGAIVDVVVEMPIEMNGSAMQWQYTGHVVRVERGDSLFIRNRIGVQFDCYEVMPSIVNEPVNLIPNFCVPRAAN